MAAPVPAVERAARVLDLLSTRGRAGLTASEVSGQLEIHKATCFSILMCLTELGLVHRNPADKTYRLGPELVRLGWSTIDQTPGIAEARREMFQLANNLDVGCFACIVIDDEMVILDRAGTDEPAFELPTNANLRVPVRPPEAAVYVAWSPPEAIEEWLGRSEFSSSDRGLLLRAVRAIRARGYSIGGRMEVELQLEQFLTRLEGDDHNDRLAVTLELADLIRTHGVLGRSTPGEAHSISYIIAPAFNESGTVALTLTVVGRPGQLTDANVDVFADPLLAAVDRVTTAIGGRRPDTTSQRMAQ